MAQKAQGSTSKVERFNALEF